MTQSMTSILLAKVGKLRIADHARLIADNQKTLDRTNAQDGRARNLHGRIDDAIAKATHGANLADAEPSCAAKEDAMQIFVDSPVTMQAPGNEAQPAPPAASGLKKAALAAALLGAGGGLGMAVPLALDALKPSTPAVTPADNNTQYELRIGVE